MMRGLARVDVNCPKVTLFMNRRLPLAPSLILSHRVLTATQDDGKAAEEFFGRSVAEQASQRGRTVLVDPIAAGPGSVVLNNVAIHAHRRHASQCAYITA